MVRLRAVAPVLLLTGHLCSSRNIPPGLEAETPNSALMSESALKAASRDFELPGSAQGAAGEPLDGVEVVHSNGGTKSGKVDSAASVKSAGSKRVRSTRSRVPAKVGLAKVVAVKEGSVKQVSSKGIKSVGSVGGRGVARQATVSKHVGSSPVFPLAITTAGPAAVAPLGSSRPSCKALLAGRPSTPVVAAFKTMAYFLGGSSRVGVDPDKAVAKALKVIESMFTHANVGIDIATLQHLKNCAVTPDDQRTFLMQIVALGFVQTLDEPLALNLRTCPLAGVRDTFGNNIVHLAVKSGNVDVCDKVFNALQASGSVVGKLLTEKNADGYLAIDLAKMQQQADIISSLQSHYTVYTHAFDEGEDDDQLAQPVDGYPLQAAAAG